jgi:hypothetical protein
MYRPEVANNRGAIISDNSNFRHIMSLLDAESFTFFGLRELVYTI